MGKILACKKLRILLTSVGHHILMLCFIIWSIICHYQNSNVAQSNIVNSFNSHKEICEIGKYSNNIGLLAISADSVILNNDYDVTAGQHQLTAEMKMCPLIPPTLIGHMIPDTSEPVSMQEVEKTLYGGIGACSDTYRRSKELASFLWQPPECTARHTVAIIIPTRNRTGHLLTLLRHLHPFLQRQQINYGIFVIEQSDKGKFNRAKLLNIGFMEAMSAASRMKKKKNLDCVIFHDVDHLPEDDRNLYVCPHQEAQAIQLAVAIDTENYTLTYEGFFGAVSGMSVSAFQRVNGYSNMYWGWGGEDDDISQRLVNAGVRIARSPPVVGRYTTLRHQQQARSMARFEMLGAGLRRIDYDGLNSLHYKRLSLRQTRLMIHIVVDIVSPN